MVTPGTNFSFTCPCTGPDVHVTVEFSDRPGQHALTATSGTIRENVTMDFRDPTTVSVLANTDRNTLVLCAPDIPSTTSCMTPDKVCILVVQGKIQVEFNIDKPYHWYSMQVHQVLL